MSRLRSFSSYGGVLAGASPVVFGDRGSGEGEMRHHGYPWRRHGDREGVAMVTVVCHGHGWLRRLRRVGRLGLGVGVGRCRRHLFLLLCLARILAPR